MLTFSNPASPEVEADYHAWYTEVHIPQLLTHVPGLKSAARYRCRGEAPAHRYLVVYDVDGQEEQIRSDLAARMADGSLDRSPVLEREPPPVMLFVDAIDDRGDLLPRADGGSPGRQDG
jgi:hypothetical protein